MAIHNGVNRRFFGASPLPDAELAALGIHPPFVLHAGGCTKRKNLSGLADAWPRVRSSPARRHAGAGRSARTSDAIELFGPLAGAVRLGRVDDGPPQG